MEPTSRDLQRYQELSHRDRALNTHSTETTEMRLSVSALGLPEPVFWPLAFTTKGQGQYHLERCLVREESLRPGNLCTGKPERMMHEESA